VTTPQGPPSTRRPDASMSLLIEAAMNPVDAGYAEAAARRAHAHAGPRSRVGTAGVVALAVVLGAGTVWAGRELRAPRPEVLQARTLLESEITDRNAEAQALREGNASLSAEVDTLSAEALAGAGEDVIEALQAQGAVVGTVAVGGPGLAITLSDSPRAASGAEDAADERVQDLDLQILANGLWEAGAEAVAINDQRLTAVSAIRSAGQAILVDLMPLVGPYRVEAVGDPDAMQAALARTAAASHLALLRDTYSIGVQIDPSDDLELPASPVPTLRYATPTGGTSVAPGGIDVPGSGQTAGESS
jgi:uncharacterized protein YlxW (UPF0749 family)